MGDEFTPLTAEEARHFMRRAGFGIAKKEGKKFRIDALIGVPRGEAVDKYLDFRPKGFRPKGGTGEESHNKWVKFMIKMKKGLSLGEKMTVFLHDHFATNFSTLDDMEGEKDAITMLAEQNRTLRRNVKGNFKDLVKLINLDPAMMNFLDTVRNKKEEPNENYARELLELFTLGVDDLNGNPNYTEPDIGQIARAFTGWDHDIKVGTQSLHEDEHDFNAEFLATRGPKTIFTTVGGFGAAGRDFDDQGEGEIEIDRVVDIIFDHTDSDGENTVARHMTYKLLQYFALPSPDKTYVDDMIAASGFAAPDPLTQWNLGALLRAIFVDDRFFTTMAPPGPGTVKSVKWPIDYVVSTIRALDIKPKGKELEIQGGDFNELSNLLENMGQVVLEPPSVFGWDWEASWISSAALLARYELVRDITSSRAKKRFKPEKLIDTDLTDPGDIVDAVLTQLGIPDQFTAAERQVLIDYLLDGGHVPPLDLNDFDYRNEKLHGLYAIVLQSPQYMVH